jgi:microcompartment protein CcmL/EutN
MNATKRRNVTDQAWFTAIAEGRATVMIRGDVTAYCREHATAADAAVAVAGGDRLVVKRVLPRTVTGFPVTEVARFLG